MITLSPVVPRALLVAALCAATAGVSATPSTVERELVLMGTRAGVRVSAPDRARALAASERAIAALEATEARLSTWRKASELLDFERRLGAGTARPGEVLDGELAAAWRCAERTDGAFDPTIGRLVDLWGLRSGGRIPSSEELGAALESVGFAGVLRSEEGWTSRTPGIELEEGGFGKGAALDRALAAVGAEAEAVRIDLGGQLTLRGPGEWIDVADPDRRDRAVARIRVENASIATSGSSERGLVVGGRRIGHLLDPRTGRPAADFGSVTVLAPTGLEADCLSTGLYVLGPDEALVRAEAWPGVDAVVVRRGAAGPSVSWTRGLEGRLELAGRVREAMGAAGERAAAREFGTGAPGSRSAAPAPR